MRPGGQWTRRALVHAGVRAGALAAVVGVARNAWPKDANDVYVADVECLLEELGSKAAALLKQKGVAWGAVEKEFRAAAKQVKDDVAHVKLCTRLVARLRDGHAGLRDLKVELPDESKGRRWTGPAFHLATSGAKMIVKQAWAQAAEAGLAAGTELREIDERPARAWLDAKVASMRDEQGFSTDHQALYAACHWGLGDWEGSLLALEWREGTKSRKARVERRGGNNFVPSGPVFPPKDLTSVGRQSYGRTESGNAYVHLRDVPDGLPDQLDQALSAVGDAPGLVLDMRANGGGGCDHEAVFGRFVPEGKAWRQYRSAGARPYVGPMVVIVDAGVRSAGETVAGMFKEDGRAYAIGESPTAGMSSQKTTVAVPSGKFSVLFSVSSNKGRFNGGKGIEGLGVPPHEVVPYDPDELARGVDTHVRRAEELLANGFPKGAVAYEPPKRPR